MTLDAITISTFAMFSLLSGSVVCTEPTEADEVKKRYDDMVKLLTESDNGYTEIHLSGENTYFPAYEGDNWPWAMSMEDYREFVRNRIAPGLGEFDNDPEMPARTLTMLLANEAIETKYRLSRVKKKLYKECYTPF